MTRPLKAHIDLNAFRQNFLTAKRLHGGKGVAVIKANAYGHGAIQCAKAVEDVADAFAVASIGEANQIRSAGIIGPILLLEGFFDASELVEIAANNYWAVIHSDWQMNALLNAKLASAINVWLKVDTGMHRLGVAPSKAKSMHAALCASDNVNAVVLMTHFANADNVAMQHTAEQLDVFVDVLQTLQSEVGGLSVANSAGILAWQTIQISKLGPLEHSRDETWARPGIMLYGADPILNSGDESQVQAVMTLSSELIAIQQVNKGESAGYSSLFTAERDTRLGVVACGYADGYPRLATGAPVMVSGQFTQVVGRVSMDMLFVDITDIPQAEIGAEVELWGNKVLANTVAEAAGTSAYELFCNVKRASFAYNTVKSNSQ